MHAEREDGVKTQGEDDHLHTEGHPRSQKLGEMPGKDLSSMTHKMISNCLHLDLKLLASRNMRVNF